MLKLPVLFNGNCPVEIMGYGRRDGLVLRRLPPDDVVVATIFGHEVRITSPAMTVVDNARWHSAGEAIRVGDEVVREGRATQADIERCMRLRGHRSGAEKARHALNLINGRAASPRESDVRVTLWENGFRPPKQQVEIVDVCGALSAGLTSFYPERSIAIEYDGRDKTRGIYGGDPYRAINKERDRERRLISEGVNPLRVTNESFVSRIWLTELARVWHLRGAFPASQWRSA